MTKFQDQLFTDLMRESGPALQGTGRRLARRRRTSAVLAGWWRAFSSSRALQSPVLRRSAETGEYGDAESGRGWSPSRSAR
jgi:hypothetical protein